MESGYDMRNVALQVTSVRLPGEACERGSDTDKPYLVYDTPLPAGIDTAFGRALSRRREGIRGGVCHAYTTVVQTLVVAGDEPRIPTLPGGNGKYCI